VPALHDIGQIAWSADGAQIAVLSQTPKIGHHDVHSTLISAALPRAKNRRHSQRGERHRLGQWRRDLAFASTTTLVLTPDHLWTVPVSGGAPVDRTPSSRAPLPVSLAARMARSGWRCTRASKWKWILIATASSKRHIAGRRALRPFRSRPPARTLLRRLAFAVGDPTHATNVAVLRDGQVQKITHEGDDTLANVSLGDVRVVNWTAKDGTKLQGIVTFPADYQPGQKGRFLVLPHGGPEENDRLVFDLFSRMVAGMGYIVLQPEYRGSTGYGSEFLAAIYQHFGDRAYSDVDSARISPLHKDGPIRTGWRSLDGVPAAS